jgi:lipoyl(octanoyl) transferase
MQRRVADDEVRRHSCGMDGYRLESLTLIRDGSHEADHNMAADEALLMSARQPSLRVYGWLRPCWSVGYRYQGLTELDGLPVVRRPTGGGAVRHDADSFTYCLVLPSGHEAASWRASLLYQWLHYSLLLALTNQGLSGLSLATAEQAVVGLQCFAAPVENDLMRGGTKLAGAAQRRTRWGILQQGSVCVPVALEHWLPLLAASVSESCSLDLNR